MKLSKGQKLLFIGDSITDVGRERPIGEGRPPALGGGYVSFVEGLLHATYPELGLRVVNMGTSGNTVRDLKSRWKKDVLALEPDWLAIMIGTNDVWRQYDMPAFTEEHVYLKEYEATLDDLVTRTRPLVEGMVLMTPFFLESNKQDEMRVTMDTYGAIVKKIADAHDCIFVDTQKAFEPVLDQVYSAVLAWDRVHPSPTGHFVLAKAFLSSIGFEWK